MNNGFSNQDKGKKFSDLDREEEFTIYIGPVEKITQEKNIGENR
ncbi:MAG: hypothetical protein ACFFB5_07285 [Promethearchaeota archaeon]